MSSASWTQPFGRDAVCRVVPKGGRAHQGHASNSESRHAREHATAIRVLASVPIILTWLPASKTGQGWVRIWDFPRAQITVLGLLAEAALLGWGGGKGVDRALAAILGASMVYQAAKMAPYTRLYPRQVPAARGAAPECGIRIFMANVLQENRRSDLMLQAIREARADIVCLVETNEWWVNELAGLDAEYPWVTRCPQENHYGMLLYSRLPIIDCEVRHVVTDDVPSIRAVVRLRSGDEVDLYALHPSPPLPESPSYGRDAELVLTGREIARRRRPAIIVGDLNDVAWSYTAKLFQRVSHMVDPRVGRGMFNTFDANHPLARYPLDHVFHTRDFTLRKLRVMRHTGSDHFPILADLAYTPDRKHEVPLPTPTAADLENAAEMVEDAREARPYVDEDGKGKVAATPS